MSDRAYLAEVGKRPGMFVGRVTYFTVTAFLLGYDAHSGHRVLAGWDDWLTARRGRDCDHAWPGKVLHLALPEGWTADLAPGQDRHAITTLFALLDAFLGEREPVGKT
ncbi:hypothetical protein [Cryptosporangium phraense]|uniref:Uncharacterized protein n=1 Tax=Cryptosporangium phraense TaxID=2593070 RepID=A0A545ARS7_9ACTN|nr:hypothetical protein [Cryptosporangium phraense]TQS44029.1 hypothetical protein FL583_16375 [Cryptosporangium phraense]